MLGDMMVRSLSARYFAEWPKICIWLQLLSQLYDMFFSKTCDAHPQGLVTPFCYHCQQKGVLQMDFPLLP